MTKGIALAVGVNSIEPKHYDDWSGELDGCKADAGDISDILTTEGFKVTKLLTNNATRDRTIREIQGVTKTLESDDIFVLYYAGNGGVLPDLNDNKASGMYSTWCLYDGQLVDDELNGLLAELRSGVRVVVISDTCVSGTVTMAMGIRTQSFDMLNSNIDSEGGKYRFMPRQIASRTYRNNMIFYQEILTRDDLASSVEKIKASCIKISACQDNQFAADGASNGLFTAKLIEVWKEGQFKGGYRKFHKTIVHKMPPVQTANYYTFGKNDPQFELQTPFTI